jgi:hypothetical protein
MFYNLTEAISPGFGYKINILEAKISDSIKFKRPKAFINIYSVKISKNVIAEIA